MRISVSIFFLFWFGVNNAFCREAKLTLEDISSEQTHSVLAIMNWTNLDHTYIQGSGFLVGREGYFITAAHVLEGYKPHERSLGANLYEKKREFAERMVRCHRKR